MASEIPGGPTRRKVVRKPDERSTDRYYRSADVSTVDLSAGLARVTKPGAPPPRRRVDEKSTDKYYAADAHTGRGSAPARLVGRTAGKTSAAVAAIARVGAFVIDAPEAVKEVVDRAAAEAATNPDRPVVITIKRGEPGLLRRARAYLDSLVTRESVSEDVARDVRFQYAPAPSTKTLPPVPAETKTAVDPSPDPLAFLMADDPDGSEAADRKMAEAQEAVELALTGGERLPGQQMDGTAAPIEPEEDNDFLLVGDRKLHFGVDPGEPGGDRTVVTEIPAETEE